jgi:hypothetical protein
MANCADSGFGTDRCSFPQLETRNPNPTLRALFLSETRGLHRASLHLTRPSFVPRLM